MKQQHRKSKIIMLLVCASILKINGPVFADKNKVDFREMAVDLAIGGMKQGSHILSPKSGAGINQTSKIPGKELSPQINTGNQTGGGANLETNKSETSAPHTEIPLETVPTETIPETPTTPPETIESGSTDTSIITVGADVNLSEDNINADANLAINPNAGGALLDAEATASTDPVNQELTSDAGLLVDVSENTTHVETATLGTEYGTSTAAPVGETEAGLEADVEATGSGDSTADPADGLSSLP